MAATSQNKCELLESETKEMLECEAGRYWIRRAVLKLALSLQGKIDYFISH